MTSKLKLNRRNFLKQAAGAIGASTLAEQSSASSSEDEQLPARQPSAAAETIRYPREFRGRQLRMISFPLGGVAAGSLGLGGRGQLINWEIFNRPNKGYRPDYAFPSIWVEAAGHKPVARVLESRIQPPYEGQDGLGASNAPGLSRLESAVFTGQYPLAHIDFEDRTLPVQVALDAFSPFIPHNPDDSGLPVGILRYLVKNPGPSPADVSIAFSIENPVSTPEQEGGAAQQKSDRGRHNEFLSRNGVAGLRMSNPALPADHPMAGEFVLAASNDGKAKLSHWTGWPQGRWWNAPLHFWDQFSKTGELGEESGARNTVGVLSLKKTIPAGATAEFEFILAWHFPNRTPGWCGWDSPEGENKTIIGNAYSVRFKNAWEAVSYTTQHLEELEKQTRLFAEGWCHPLSSAPSWRQGTLRLCRRRRSDGTNPACLPRLENLRRQGAPPHHLALH